MSDGVLGCNKTKGRGDSHLCCNWSNNNKTSDKYCIAMGTNGRAKKDRSVVINLGIKKATSNNIGEFRNSDSFTLEIDNTKAIIDGKKIKNFIALIFGISDNDADQHRRRRHLAT